MSYTKFLVFVVMTLAAGLPALAQDAAQDNVPEQAVPGAPRQFRELYLGMGVEELKQALRDDGLFTFIEEDVSFLPVSSQTLIETTGPSFVRQAFFQTQPVDGADVMFSMAFTLNTSLVDYYSVFTAFRNKYGDPVSLSPSESVWEDEQTRVSLERPLTVKYLDMTVFNQLLEASKTRESVRIQTREAFLNEF